MSTTQINDGGPAFPVAIMARQADGQPMTGYDFGVQGMSMRDWLAGMAMNGFMSDSQQIAATHMSLKEGQSVASEAAKTSYAIADAMLAAREGGKQS